MKNSFENLDRLARNTAILDQVLDSQWSRDPREGKAWECFHFDEYCFEVLKINASVEAGLFSAEAAVRAALKPYLLYVTLYDLGLTEAEIDQANLTKVKQAFSKLVDENWEYVLKLLKQRCAVTTRFMGKETR